MQWAQVNRMYLKPAKDAWELGNYEEAEKLFQQGLRETDSDGYLLLKYAEFLEFVNRLVEARQMYDLAETKLPLADFKRQARIGMERLDRQVSTPAIENVPTTKPVNKQALSVDVFIDHDGLKFRSQTEIRIYEVLKKRNVLFLANETAVMGGKGKKREPDFLVCQNGRWGVLEVMGSKFHENATNDHERARLFKHYGLNQIEFYDSERCYHDPDGVVEEFLGILKKS